MNTLILTLFDVLLIGSALVLAWFSLSSRDLRRAVILFIAFGLLLALIWLRLKAPDVALAEAAIGAGLTGALLLSAVNREKNNAIHNIGQKRAPAILFRVIAFSTLFIAMGVILAVVTLASLMTEPGPRLADQVFDYLAQTGVSNPVTGVLLDFRAYDTMLELAVLLAACFGVMALAPASKPYPSAGIILPSLTRFIVPLLIIFSGYLLWAGAHAPGGAFQAAALLAAAAVVLHFSGTTRPCLPQGLLLRALMVSGVAAFLLVALAVMSTGNVFFDYPATWSAQLILLIEVFATLSIAIALLIAYLCGEPKNWLHDVTTANDGYSSEIETDKEQRHAH